ncbi:hypothetical protein FB107DRAFT_252023 [Schizophyllum commune]
MTQLPDAAGLPANVTPAQLQAIMLYLSQNQVQIPVNPGDPAPSSGPGGPLPLIGPGVPPQPASGNNTPPPTPRTPANRKSRLGTVGSAAAQTPSSKLAQLTLEGKNVISFTRASPSSSNRKSRSRTKTTQPKAPLPTGHDPALTYEEPMAVDDKLLPGQACDSVNASRPDDQEHSDPFEGFPEIVTVPLKPAAADTNADTELSTAPETSATAGATVSAVANNPADEDMQIEPTMKRRINTRRTRARFKSTPTIYVSAIEIFRDVKSVRVPCPGSQPLAPGPALIGLRGRDAPRAWPPRRGNVARAPGRVGGVPRAVAAAAAYRSRRGNAWRVGIEKGMGGGREWNKRGRSGRGVQWTSKAEVPIAIARHVVPRDRKCCSSGPCGDRTEPPRHLIAVLNGLGKVPQEDDVIYSQASSSTFASRPESEAFEGDDATAGSPGRPAGPVIRRIRNALLILNHHHIAHLVAPNPSRHPTPIFYPIHPLEKAAAALYQARNAQDDEKRRIPDQQPGGRGGGPRHIAFIYISFGHFALVTTRDGGSSSTCRDPDALGRALATFPRGGGHARGASRPRSPIRAGPGASGWLPGHGTRADLTSRKITIRATPTRAHVSSKKKGGKKSPSPEDKQPSPAPAPSHVDAGPSGTAHVSEVTEAPKVDEDAVRTLEIGITFDSASLFRGVREEASDVGSSIRDKTKRSTRSRFIDDEAEEGSVGQGGSGEGDDLEDFIVPDNVVEYDDDAPGLPDDGDKDGSDAGDNEDDDDDKPLALKRESDIEIVEKVDKGKGRAVPLPTSLLSSTVATSAASASTSAGASGGPSQDTNSTKFSGATTDNAGSASNAAESSGGLATSGSKRSSKEPAWASLKSVTTLYPGSMSVDASANVCPRLQVNGTPFTYASHNYELFQSINFAAGVKPVPADCAFISDFSPDGYGNPNVDLVAAAETNIHRNNLIVGLMLRRQGCFINDATVDPAEIIAVQVSPAGSTLRYKSVLADTRAPAVSITPGVVRVWSLDTPTNNAHPVRFLAMTPLEALVDRFIGSQCMNFGQRELTVITVNNAIRFATVPAFGRPTHPVAATSSTLSSSMRRNNAGPSMRRSVNFEPTTNDPIAVLDARHAKLPDDVGLWTTVLPRFEGPLPDNAVAFVAHTTSMWVGTRSTTSPSGMTYNVQHNLVFVVIIGELPAGYV